MWIRIGKLAPFWSNPQRYATHKRNLQRRTAHSHHQLLLCLLLLHALLSLLSAALLLSSEILCSRLLHFVFKVVSYSITSVSIRWDHLVLSYILIVSICCFSHDKQYGWTSDTHWGFISWVYTISNTWLQGLAVCTMCIYMYIQYIRVCIYCLSNKFAKIKHAIFHKPFKGILPNSLLRKISH